MDIRQDITYMGETDFRGKRARFGIKAEDRTKHMYVIGKTGMGKSTFLENMAVQDIMRGEGLAFFDPHGASVEALLDYIPDDRIDDVIYFAPFDADHPISFNVMEDVDPDKRSLVSNGLLEAFKKIWPDAFSARMEYILGNALLALLEYPDSTLLGINRMLSDKEYRKKVVDNLTDESVKAFWVDEFGSWTEKFASEASSAIQNKIGQFTTSPIIRNMVGQPKSSFDLREVIDGKKILMVNLSKGKLGSQNSALIGSMLITKLYLSAMSRADTERSQLLKLPAFNLYVDEFQNFANDSFADILSEARKYKLNLIVAHQYVSQMPDTVRDAIVGNVGSMVVFRVGPEDAELFEREFVPVFTQDDIVNIGKYQMYLRLMIDGVGSKPFSARALPPITKPEISNEQNVIDASRAKYTKSRAEVEAGIKEWYIPIPSQKTVEYGDFLEKRKMEILAGGGNWVDKESGKTLRGEGDVQKKAKEYLQKANQAESSQSHTTKAPATSKPAFVKPAQPARPTPTAVVRKPVPRSVAPPVAPVARAPISVPTPPVPPAPPKIVPKTFTNKAASPKPKITPSVGVKKPAEPRAPQSLQGLLNDLDKKDSSNIKKVAPDTKKPEERGEIKLAEKTPSPTISLKDLAKKEIPTKKIDTKSASRDTKSALQVALARAVEANKNKESAKPTTQKTMTPSENKNSIPTYNTTKSQNDEFMSHSTKEIPEDILRRVLE
ncbi:MAG: type IV secretion system DNA-binding domain-containing protein [Candidatus Nomurabacteria bacterium]|nr:type IV secretion system DNA-binding domain-containing protein [Candidatus Nomurabacteria bacterium]